AKVVQAVLHLPRRHREIIHLYYHQELSMKQIAQRLRVHESRVSQLHTWALERLRRSLAAALGRKAPASAPWKKSRAQRPVAPAAKYFRTASQSSSVSTPMVSSAASAT
ncbi:MAG: sigma-70 family RNA polymerase sigma factor, partial [Acidobacteria bacterium]|nr:sigma-70 family RNA polymerase sigma factor [Acidobacteriota bacterium]